MKDILYRNGIKQTTSLPASPLPFSLFSLGYNIQLFTIAYGTVPFTPGRKIVHFTFGDGTEMVEEYASDTDALLGELMWRLYTRLLAFLGSMHRVQFMY